MGTLQVDLIIKNVWVFNSYFKKFDVADVWVAQEKILFIDERQQDREAVKVIDGTGLYMIPGLIDIHMHIESSMMTPQAFCEHVVGCGVTTIVSEPHEIANVAGIDGIRAMIQAGEDAAIDIFYGIPSCVPSTSETLETTGGRIGCEEMKQLKEHPAVVCVGEVMNYRQIIKESPPVDDWRVAAEQDSEIKRFITWLRREDKIFPIEGHCPSLMDYDLAKFLYLGINGDHTEHSMEELRQRFAAGMFMEIQEKMLKPEVIEFITTHHLEEHFCFVTDDVMADTLVEEGQLDVVVRKAIALGMKPEQAIYNATYIPARRMNLFDRGCLAPGKLADFVLVSDLANLTIHSVYKNGRAVRPECRPLSGERQAFPRDYYQSIHLEEQTGECLTVTSDLPDGLYPMRVIKVTAGGTRTKEVRISMEVRGGIVKWEETDCLLVTVLERYGKNGNIAHGFLTGVCHQSGAVASSYAHDSHNLIVAGKTKQDMLIALNEVIKMQGGMTVVQDGQILAGLSLPVGGILSEEPALVIGGGLRKVRQAMEQLGYRHYNPIMSFATLTLPVSPSLKITDQGLIDVEHGIIVPISAHCP